MLGITLAPYGQVPGAFPYGVGYSYGGDGTYMCPEDPFHYTRGEAGFYSDTQLGAAATEYSPMNAIMSLMPRAVQNQGLISKIKARSALKGTRRTRAHAACCENCACGYTGGCPGCPDTVAIASTRPSTMLGSSIPGDFDLQPTYGFVPQMSGWVSSKSGPVQSPWTPPNGWRPSPLSGLGDAVNSDAAAILSEMQQQNRKMFTLSVLTTLAVGVSAVVAVIRNAKAIKSAVL